MGPSSARSWTTYLLLLGVAQLGAGSPSADKDATCPDGINSCDNQKCCALFPIIEDIQANLFDGGRCGSMVHKALRLSFHDAIAYSPKLGGGGADGSIISFSDTELTYIANAGVRSIVEAEKHYVEKYDISAGDFIQFAAAVGITNCPGTPRLDFLLGRPDATGPAPNNLTPGPAQSVDGILARMADAGFNSTELIALMASHSIAASDNVDKSIPGTPFDSTPSEFDTQFYIEVQLRGKGYPGSGGNLGEVESPLPGELRIQSDYALARDPRTSCDWQSYASSQDLMQSGFKAAMRKLSLVGQDESDLIDCSDVIPEPRRLKSKPHLPAGMSMDDIDQACDAEAFPSLDPRPGAIEITPVHD